MIGGIFLEIPFGDVYKVETVSHIRTNLNKLLGFPPKYFTKGNFDKEIVDRIMKIGKEDISRHRSTVRKEHKHRSSDLIRSTVFAVFKDGKWDRKYYRFDSMQPQEAPPLVEHDWDLDQRAVEFLSEYEPYYDSRFTAVIAATAPYAVRVEANGGFASFNARIYYGYNLAVLKYGISRIGGALMKARPDSQKGKAIYGYIFESTGAREIKQSGL
jgi:hypothetical protein